MRTFGEEWTSNVRPLARVQLLRHTRVTGQRAPLRGRPLFLVLFLDYGGQYTIVGQ